MPFPMVVIALDLGDIFLFFHKNNVNTCGRRVVAAALFLSSAMPEISWEILVFFACLALMGRLLTRHVSKEKISRLGFSRIFFLLFCRLVSSETLNANLTGTKG